MASIVTDDSDISIYNIVAHQGTTFKRTIYFTDTYGYPINIGSYAYLSGNGLVLPGISGNYASTPDSTALSITGDIDIAVRVNLNDWTPATQNNLVTKRGSVYTFSYVFAIRDGSLGKLMLTTSIDGTNVLYAYSTVAPTVSDGSTIWVRTTRASSSGDVIFYTAPDSDSVPTVWTKLGDTVSTSAGTIYDNMAPLEIGATTAGGTNLVSGIVYRTIIKNGINGTTVFDANFANQSIGTTSFTESSSNAATVTINSFNSASAAMKVRKSYPSTSLKSAYRDPEVLNLSTTSGAGIIKALYIDPVNGKIIINIPASSITSSLVPAGIYDYDLEVTLGQSPGGDWSTGDIVKVIAGLFEVKQEMTY